MLHEGKTNISVHKTIYSKNNLLIKKHFNAKASTGLPYHIILIHIKLHYKSKLGTFSTACNSEVEELTLINCGMSV